MTFAAAYGAEHLEETRLGDGDLRTMRAFCPRNDAMVSIRDAWSTIDYRLAREIKESTNVLRLSTSITMFTIG